MQKYADICDSTEVTKHNNKAPRKPAPKLNTGRRPIFLPEANPHLHPEGISGHEECLAVPCLLKMNGFTSYVCIKRSQSS